jgi:hypothetical protein
MSTRNEVELTEALRESFEAGMKQGRTQEADRAAYASYRALTLTVDLNRPSTKVGPVVSAMVFNGTVFEPTSVGENSCRFPIFLGNLPELEQNLGRPFGVEDLQEAWWGTQVSLVDQVGVASGRFAEGSRFVPDSEGDTLRSINLIRTEVEVGPDRFHTLAQGYNSETGQPLDVIPAMK